MEHTSCTQLENIHCTLANAATLAKPNYTVPFVLNASVADDGLTANACLYQQRQGKRHVEQRATPCTQFTAALTNHENK